MAAIPGLDFPVYVYKPRRGIKRGEESKDAYKLPHRLIEKKRRDRINECIAQLKDLLPEHLKLSTLGHLEKAVVLELTLKHVKALNNLLEQQQQQIISLQSGTQMGGDQSEVVESRDETFRSGFHLCAREVLQYVARPENGRELSPTRIVDHLSKVASDLLRRPARPDSPPAARPATETRENPAATVRVPEPRTKNCVPVIQRAFPQSGEQSGSDTDTDSGYGGEHDKDAQRAGHHDREGAGPKHAIKEEWDERGAKRPRAESPEDERHGGYAGYSPPNPPTPLCMPFYVLPPMSAAAYLPILEKCWYPGSVPMLYPGVTGPAVLSPEKLPPSLIRRGSPATPTDSPALHHALKHAPPLHLETND